MSALRHRGAKHPSQSHTDEELAELGSDPGSPAPVLLTASLPPDRGRTGAKVHR